jgi:hypothetical protein
MCTAPQDLVGMSASDTKLWVTDCESQEIQERQDDIRIEDAFVILFS